MREDRSLIVVEKNGQTTVVTGWRAVLLAVGALLGALAAFIFLAFIFFGIALTVGAVLLVVVPAAIIVGVLGSLFRRRP
ncbi:MAG: hypothetical protein WC829_13750 [Hyphomicrobium sp.]|jgi:hypothetical protein